jgi:hypothetical protein
MFFLSLSWLLTNICYYFFVVRMSEKRENSIDVVYGIFFSITCFLRRFLLYALLLPYF